MLRNLMQEKCQRLCRCVHYIFSNLPCEFASTKRHCVLRFTQQTCTMNRVLGPIYVTSTGFRLRDHVLFRLIGLN
jgi:hypothetical protein